MINLLPSQQKEKIYSELFKKQLNNFCLMIVVIFLGSAILILNSIIFIKIQAQAIEQSLSITTHTDEVQEAALLESKVNQLNDLTVRYNNFRKNNISFSDAFLALQQIIPSGARLEVLFLDGSTKKVIISGLAQNRDDILKLEESLKKSAVFEKLDAPLSNLLERTNVNFNFTFYVKTPHK